MLLHTVSLVFHLHLLIEARRTARVKTIARRALRSTLSALLVLVDVRIFDVVQLAVRSRLLELRAKAPSALKLITATNAGNLELQLVYLLD